MSLSIWFGGQLHSSMENFLWSLGEVPTARLFLTPPHGLGDWSAAQQLFHVLAYERDCVVSSMRQRLGEPKPTVFEESWDENAEWQKAQAGVIGTNLLDEMQTHFRRVRQAQIDLLPHFTDDHWMQTRDTGWGDIPLKWLVSKTWQHTYEHTSNVMRIVLFWDTFASEA